MNIFISTLCLTFLIQIFFFSIATYFKTDKVTDLSYGLTFILLAWYALISYSKFLPYQIIVTLAVSIWGIRLAGYLFIRILKTQKDERFNGIREDFKKFAQFWFFQAIAVWVISLPVIYLLSFKQIKPFNTLMYIGIIIWLIGLLIESVADWQKYQFKNKSQNKNKWIQHGIWKYSRHPNYFGEIILWWGIFIFSHPFQAGISWLTITGPLFITFILLFVSGIPPLEKKYSQRYKNNQKYAQYKKSTSLLIPLPTKK